MRTMLFSQSKDIPYALIGSFIGLLGGAFGLVFADCPGQDGGFAFQLAGELLASIGPSIGHTLSSLNILQSRLGLLHDQRPGEFDQLFGQPFAFLGRDHGRVVTRQTPSSHLRSRWCVLDPRVRGGFYSCLRPMVTRVLPGGKMARGPLGVVISTSTISN